jgi:hypothetical protein
MGGRDAVAQVARDHPEWMDRVRACCRVQKRKGAGVPISAADVARDLGTPPTPLTPLANLGVLEHVPGMTAVRGGSRRYYFVRPGVCDALRAKG